MSDLTLPGTFVQPVSPELARVLAQAANAAYAPDPTFYVVARYAPGVCPEPYNVQQPFPTYSCALERVNALKESDPEHVYGIFGPFQNDHGDLRRPANQATVLKMLVTPQGGLAPEPAPFTIGGEQFDALFYSIQAVEKFVLPYYVQEYGVSFAAQVMAQFNDAPLALMGHLPWSEELMVPERDEQGSLRYDSQGGIRWRSATAPGEG